MDKEYIGIVAEKSLNDNRILNELEVKKIHITGHTNPIDGWYMYKVNVSKEKMEELEEKANNKKSKNQKFLI